jgi:hypothetical protein
LTIVFLQVTEKNTHFRANPRCPAKDVSYSAG